MRAPKIIGFVLQFVTIGLATAFLVIMFKPQLLHQRPVVQIRESARHPAGPAPAPASVRTGGLLSFAAAVRRAAPAVVNIYSARLVDNPRQPAEPPAHSQHPGRAQPPSDRVETGLGSGVIFSSQGYVLTNDHVIADADEIQVMLTDGRSAEAEVVGTDPDTDLAVLRIKLSGLPAITLGDSDALQVGDVVLAIGNPYGVGQTVTMGIVSATGRKRLGLSTYENFIQTDAAINPGNSGGALINTRGELVGLNTAIFSRTGGSQGIGFAIPVKLVRHVLTEIVTHGHVIRGWIGISMANVSADTARKSGLGHPYGVMVVQPIEGSPADRAGLKAGDILTRLGGQPIRDPRQMLDLVANQRPGTRIKVEGLRDGRAFSVELQIAERPPLGQQ
ncbi:MAG: trypsin-like peptidase domain-containing protein [Gammaproteobacteria bacterium]